jgi:hypothetical protein
MITETLKPLLFYNDQLFGHYPSSCSYTNQYFREWILSPAPTSGHYNQHKAGYINQTQQKPSMGVMAKILKSPSHETWSQCQMSGLEGFQQQN